MRKYRYSLKEMTSRLLKIASGIRIYLIISALASLIGNLSHMGLMGFGTAALLCASGMMDGNMTLYIVLTCLSGLLIAVCRYLEGVYSHIGAYGLLAGMRVSLFETLDRIAPAFMIDRKKGDILNIAVSDIETLEFFFAHTIGPMFTVILLPLTSVAVAWHFSRMFALVLIPVYILISVIIPLIALRSGRSLGLRYRTNLGELNAMILESVYGIRDIQIFGHGQKRKDLVMRQNDRVSRSAHGMILHQQAVTALPNFFVYLARILILSCGAYLASHGAENAAGTVIVSFTAAASFSSTFSLTFVVTHLLETFAAAERLFTIEDTQPSAEDPQNPETIGHIQSVRFDHVSFAYPGTEQMILKDTPLEISEGETIGIIGPSGVGKSTVLRLLMRFYDPSAGKILLNNTDLKQISLHQLHEKIAMLEQDTYLFDTDIAGNIALAKPDANMDEIRTAAKRAGIDEFIQTLPDGYETQMGQMGARLSGGERQRIGIARIMLADPDIIVMDEPTSSLDVLHEKELLHTLKKEYADKTVIIISHRMSTLTGCTRLLKLENGQLCPAQMQ
ncbi:MAG: thiol reductant ABC exporter subunit CydC [Erysipelotrichaceae bacterium]|nr:thiol reductant ABC exporter subunit CydC [Erysipelotrichaceae bacterium]